MPAKLDTKDLASSSVTKDKFLEVVKHIKGSPYSVVVCRSGKGKDPDAYLISSTLFNLFQSHYEKCLEYMKHHVTGEEHEALRREAERNRNMMAALFEEAREKGFADTKVSPGTWKKIHDSVRESVEVGGVEFPDPAEGRPVL